MRKIILLLFIFCFGFKTVVWTQNINYKPNIRQEIQILQTVLTVINQNHVAPIKLNDDFSKRIFKTYIDSLDTEKLFFLQSDIEEFKKYETQLDEQIKNNDLSFFDLTRKRFLQRLTEAKEIYTNVLKNKLDYSSKDIWDEKIQTKFSKNNFELMSSWQRYLKTKSIDLNKIQITPETTKEDFEKILNKYDETTALNSLEKSYLDINNVSDDYIFSHFLNSIIAQYDEHSKYYQNSIFKEHLIKTSGKVESFGFRFGLQNEFIVVSDIIPGGSAEKSKKITVGDVILKVAFDDGKPQNVAGLVFNEFFMLISSKKSNSLSFTLKKTDGRIENVTLKRSLIYKEDIFIKSGVVTKNDLKYAVVSFPKFYDELDKFDQRNSEEDFKKELLKLHEEKVTGIVLDIRDNVGGSLEAAVNIISNLVPEKNLGYYKEQKNMPIKIKSLQKINAWNKNIILLVNKNTASSAEFIASVFQQNNIGIIIGEKTFGNASTSKIFKLNDFKPIKDEKDDLGYLEVTTKTFYNTNGETLQKKGINTDINFENKDKNIRENNSIYSLVINPLSLKNTVKYAPVNKNFNTLIIKNKQRLEKNNIHKFYINFQGQKDLKEIKTLNCGLYIEKFKELYQKYNNEEVSNYNNLLNFKFTVNDEKFLNNNEKLKTKRRDWLRDLSQDYIIEEGINILVDMNNLK